MEVEYRIKGFPYTMLQTVEKLMFVCPKCKEVFTIHEHSIKESMESYNAHYTECKG